MTRREAFQEGVRILAEADRKERGTPSLDASVLLAASLGCTKEALILSYSEQIDAAPLAVYRSFIARRAAGEPVAYIRGIKEFWGRDFCVDSRVLIPRPDTELLVETALALGDEIEGLRPLRVHEACTGSGCVAISIAADRPAWRISASDISADALAVAAGNAARLLPAERAGGPLRLCLADLLSETSASSPQARAGGDRSAVQSAAGADSAAVQGAGGTAAEVLPRPGSCGLILANPPYVPASEAGPLAAEFHEPLLALDGGADGLEPYRRLVPEAARMLAPGGWLAVEADPSEAGALRALFSSVGFSSVEALSDLAGLARVTKGRL